MNTAATRKNPVISPPGKNSLDFKLVSCAGFLGLHLACFSVFFVSFSWFALAVGFFLYAARVWFIGAGYHRYFAHKTYRTSRFFQFILAFFGASAGQNGPLWWAAHHRQHHRYSDQENDVHSPIIKGFWWSHFGWLLCDRYKKTQLHLIEDFAKYPELRILDRFHYVVPILLLSVLYLLGNLLEVYAPGLQTNGPQLLVYGGLLSTIFLYHVTFMINSVAHLWGSQRFKTKDKSRNNLLLAILSFGEGWHNNHHRYPASERQGFYWWEVDFSHYILKGLSWFGIVWDLAKPPPYVYEEARVRNEETAPLASTGPSVTG